jgi:hypothetical protein
MNRDARETTRLDESFLEAIIEDLTDEEESEAMRLFLKHHQRHTESAMRD